MVTNKIVENGAKKFSQFNSIQRIVTAGEEKKKNKLGMSCAKFSSSWGYL